MNTLENHIENVLHILWNLNVSLCFVDLFWYTTGLFKDLTKHELVLNVVYNVVLLSATQYPKDHERNAQKLPVLVLKGLKGLSQNLPAEQVKQQSSATGFWWGRRQARLSNGLFLSRKKLSSY